MDAAHKYEEMRDKVYPDHTPEIAQYLTYYMKKAWQAAGLTWSRDNDAEMQTLAEYITEQRS